MITLRRPQELAVHAVLNHWMTGGGNPLVSMCVGSGKSYVQAALAKELIDRWPGVRILGLTLTQELIEQNYEAMRKYWPAANVDINSAGLKRRATNADIIFAHPMSIHKALAALGPRHIVLVDETHNVSHNVEKTVYGRIFQGLRNSVPDLRVGGFSGTLFRTDSGHLLDEWKGQRPIWDKCVYHYGLLDGIEDGFLVPLVSRDTAIKQSVQGVGVRNGEFIDKDLQKALDKDEVNLAIVDDMLRQMHDRNHVIVYEAGVALAEKFTQMIRDRGGSAVCVTGDMSNADRASAFQYFESGAAKFLTNVAIATTGYNFPPVDGVVWRRPTKSAGLLIQGSGRAMRAHPGKESALALDYAGNYERLGTIDLIDGKKSFTGGKEAPPTKVCPQCSQRHATGKLICGCGFVFPRASVEEKLSTTASSGAVLSNQVNAQWRDVGRVTYSVNRRRDAVGKEVGKPTFRITYILGFSESASEFLAFESDKPAGKHFAKQKWLARSTTDVMPTTADEALALSNTLRKPGRVYVKKEGKYYQIISVDFAVPPTRDDVFAKAAG